MVWTTPFFIWSYLFSFFFHSCFFFNFFRLFWLFVLFFMSFCSYAVFTTFSLQWETRCMRIAKGSRELPWRCVSLNSKMRTLWANICESWGRKYAHATHIVIRHEFWTPFWHKQMSKRYHFIPSVETAWILLSLPTKVDWKNSIGHFRIRFGLFLKTSPDAKLITWKLVCICMWMKTNFHVKELAPGLALKKRPKVIEKRLII